MHPAMDGGLREFARREPERVAFRFAGDRTVSFSELEALANRFANLFAACGLKRGDHAAALLGNSIEVIALVWAAARSGVYLTPVANALSAVDTAYIVDNSTAKLLVADARYREVAESLPAACLGVAHFFSVGGELKGFRALAPILAEMPSTPRPDETPGAIMLYSSGTTGRPKGIWRPLPEIPDLGVGPPPFARDIIAMFGFTPATRYLSTAPLYHAAPLRFGLAVHAAGGEVTVMEKFDAGLSLDLIERHGLNASQWVPTMFQRLLALPAERRAAFHAPQHRQAIHGAAPCTPALKRAMIDWWGPVLEEYYAGSESIGLTSISSEEWRRKPGSVGRAKRGVIHIVGPDDQELPAGETGRVTFGDVSMFSYFGDDAKTAARRSRQGFQTLGDIGRLDADGYLYLSDRADDMIISGGVNVYPQEIEAALEEHPGVAECGVVGFPDEEFQERPVAFVVARQAWAGDEETLAAALRRFLGARLGKIKQPREIRIVAELPRTPTGKLLRRELRKSG